MYLNRVSSKSNSGMYVDMSHSCEPVTAARTPLALVDNSAATNVVANTATNMRSTDKVSEHLKLAYLRPVIADAMCELQMAVMPSTERHGRVETCDLNLIRLSRFASDGLAYGRLARQSFNETRHVLVMVPIRGVLAFSQAGLSVRCTSGMFVLACSEDEFAFSCHDDAQMWVMRIPADALSARLVSAARYCGRAYDATQGAARLFCDYLQMMGSHLTASHSDQLASLMGGQLLELLVASLQQQQPDSTPCSQSHVREAHLARIEEHLLQSLFDPALSPSQLAQACRISLRYLHLIFKDTGQSVSQRIRDLRLQSAHALLSCPVSQVSVTQVAYTVGFSDHAQFSHAFRKKFGHAPSDMLRRHASKRASPRAPVSKHLCTDQQDCAVTRT